MQACSADYALTAVNQLKGRRLDRRKVKASYTSYGWFLLVQYQVH
jgi:CRISPR/Cas system CMR-associated protein Cmr5 small subunit